MTFEKEQWAPSFVDKFHRIDEVPLAICKTIYSAIKSIPGCKPNVETLFDNEINDFAICQSKEPHARSRQERAVPAVQSELERLLHELQLRLNGQALIIMHAPIQQKPGAMPAKVPKLELVRVVLSIHDVETPKGEILIIRRKSSEATSGLTGPWALMLRVTKLRSTANQVPRCRSARAWARPR